MAWIKQKHRTDCGIAALAMLCNVTYEEAERAIPWRRHGCLYGTDTKQLKEGAEKLGYMGHGTKTGQLKRLASHYWWDIPHNSLVKVPHPTDKSVWHWVAWRKGKVYCPARGVYNAEIYGNDPVAYMQFTKEESDA